MNQYHMPRKVLMAEASGGWLQGRLRLGLMDGVEVALGKIGMMVEAVQQCAKDRKEWRAQVQVSSIYGLRGVCLMLVCVI